jgi:hypothetical protein
MVAEGSVAKRNNFRAISALVRNRAVKFTMVANQSGVVCYHRGAMFGEEWGPPSPTAPRSPATPTSPGTPPFSPFSAVPAPPTPTAIGVSAVLLDAVGQQTILQALYFSEALASIA